ncbi:ornithine cyclodeaminase family protein [Legionella quateirensis]|uniref:Ornithine cyclodeaminase n=1 Tax=Legionella quateirensis TaxID=45072 RepID=A0A378KW25_9GAMM|nr:ornithine cyclodeaminase [Legionella quateirensis]KTD51198.1 ornithine cyclodeaminase [Legionella quateirensis]STY17558.1 ornithine cyclodeaminase [Legionella quateirensis]
MSLMVLAQNEIQQSINMEQAIKIMESAFKEYHENKALTPLRTGISVDKEHALMLTMPAYLSQQNALGLKVVSVFPKNRERDKPVITGALLVMNEQTGEPQAIMEAGYLTALRTGAVCGLATQYLARPDARHVAIIGSGVQAMTQLEAVSCVRTIKRVSIWSRNFENALSFAQKIKSRFEVTCYEQLQDAVSEADIICTATSSTEPLLYWSHLKKQVHINAVGSHTPEMREIANDVLANSIVIVDQMDAALKEAGEVVFALQEDCIQLSDIVELGAVVSGKEHQMNSRTTVFKSVGLAIQDVSIAHAVYVNALAKGLGTQVNLM